jgi:hypothetical protein
VSCTADGGLLKARNSSEAEIVKFVVDQLRRPSFMEILENDFLHFTALGGHSSRIPVVHQHGFDVNAQGGEIESFVRIFERHDGIADGNNCSLWHGANAYGQPAVMLVADVFPHRSVEELVGAEMFSAQTLSTINLIVAHDLSCKKSLELLLEAENADFFVSRARSGFEVRRNVVCVRRCFRKLRLDMD